jgi:hypothetical protein
MSEVARLTRLGGPGTVIGIPRAAVALIAEYPGHEGTSITLLTSPLIQIDVRETTEEILKMFGWD